MSKQALAAPAAVAAVLALSASAQAEYAVGASVVVPQDNVTASITYMSASAAFTGVLSFLGQGTPLLITVPANDTDEPGLGQQLFANHQDAPSDTQALQGVFSQGDVLHFGYQVTDPADAADVLRTDVPGTVGQFAWDAENGLLHVEDLQPGHFWYDADYNDIIVHIAFSSVPAPPTAIIAAIGMIAGTASRRRLGG
jgi:hypothetical protein